MNQQSAAHTRQTPLAKLAPLAVRLAALWVAGVTCVKLFDGSPNSLPPFIRDNFFGPTLNFNLSIGVELSCAFLALLHPRTGFVAMSALMCVFVGVLVYLITLGAASCGCFGGAIDFPPAGMLAIDGALLAFMLVTRPWTSIRATRPPLILIGLATAISFAAPWLVIPTAKVAPPPAPTIDGSQPAVWQLPVKPWPRYVNLVPAEWPGKSIHEIELAPWLDTRSLPSDANRWLIYSHSCEHCRDYLRKLYNEAPVDPELVLVEIVDGQERKVDLVPDTPWKAFLPSEVDFVQSYPWELQLEGGVIKQAQFRGAE